MYVHHGKGLGGAPLSLLYLVEGLDKNKYHPIVLFLYASEVVDLYRSKGIEVVGPVNLHDFPHTKIWWYKWYQPHHFFKSLFSTIKTLFYSAKFYFKKIKPDIVHLNTSSLLAWGIIAKRMNIPVVWHIREPLAPGYFGIRRKIVQKIVGKFGTRILPICNNDAKPWLGNSNVRVVYNAADRNFFDHTLNGDEFRNKYNLKDDPTILFLGGLSREKGTIIIFKAFKQLLKILPEAKLVVAGYFDFKVKSRLNLKSFFAASRYQAEVLEQFERIEKSVVFTGPIRNVPEAMAASDVVVFPASVGHFARPIIEAGLMKKPVIASKLAPMDELVIDKQTGFLIDPSDIGLWAKKLNLLLVDSELNQKMGEAGFKFCQKNFDVKDQIVKIRSIYSELIKNL